MAAEIIGNALLSAFIQVVFDRMVSPQVLDLFGGIKLDETLLSKLKVILLSIDAVADDAEEKQVRDPGVREWLFEVKDAVLDAEDILDEIHCELSNCEVEAESESQIRTCTVPDSFNDTYSSFNREIYSRMKQVLDKLEYLANQKGVLGLKEATCSGVGSGSKLKEATCSVVGLDSKVSQKLPSTSLMVEDVIYGREDEKEMILNWLTSETDNQLSILSIVGMGGAGKTTLAQLVYNDSRIYEANFDIKVWVRVSDDFNVFKLTRSILETIVVSIDDSEDLEMVRGRLREELSGKRFFLVLDDVWNESPDRWEDLQICLNHGAKGSKILVTTRNEHVASAMRSNKMLYLTSSSELHCWHFFVIHAFQDYNPQLNDELKGICEMIVKKCKGFPLALKTIGSLLHTMSSLSEFESVLHHKIWDTLEDGSKIFPALFLSYLHLPSYLKQCFAYCALFPKDYEFVKQDLIQMWMAGNFLQCHQQSKSAEEIGEQYFNDLLSRSFFQSNMNETCFLMHDLINDLAKYVCGDICFRLEVDKVKNIPQKTRHFSFAVNDTQYCDGFRSLRTFMPTSRKTNFGDLWLCKMSIRELLSKFKFLRILSLSWCYNLKEVPDSIGDLKHLRSLDLSNAGIKELPDSICLLYNMQILKLSNCTNLEELPSNLHKLINLRCLEFIGTKLRKVPDSIGDLVHLHSLDLSKTCIKELPNSTCSLYNLQILKLSFCINLEELPSNLHKLVNLRCLEFVGTKLRKVPVHLGKLQNLQITGSFYVGKSNEFSIQQLGELNLCGELSIGELQNVVNPSDALALDLKNKRQLVELKLEWNQNWNQNQIPDDPLKEQEVFENLQPSQRLRKLSIMNYGGTQFPYWLFDNSLRNVVFLRLHNCKYCLCLPPLGLLRALRHLTITGLDGIVGIYAYFYGSNSSPFISLETLEFSDMKEWKEWEYEDMTCAFPRLRLLSLKQCPKLKGYLPKQIPHLRKLVIRDCKQLVATAPTTTGICDLELQDCGKLQFDYHPPTLKRLTIRGHNMEASVLETIEHVICHTSLEFLLIDSCPNMNIPMSLCYKMLEKLKISGACDSLTIFPLDLFPRLSQLELRSPNLRMISLSHTHNHLKDLRISGCRQFQSLPEQMHALLPSLENLLLKDCPKVESFPEGGLPSNLTRMDLSNCYNLITSLKEAMGANTRLRTLSIGDMHVKSFPNEGLLPISLKVLQIHSCVWLEKLDYKGLCQLSSLEELILDDCTGLKCLPEEGLPRSISIIRISRYCPLLKQRCLEPSGEYWGKIAHIKNMWIDDKPI